MLDLWIRVEKLLDAKRITYLEVAQALGVGKTAITTWKQNDRIPRADDLFNLADFLGVSAKWLLTGEQDEEVDHEVQRLLKNDRLMSLMHRLSKADWEQMKAIEAVMAAFRL
jgi:transcriptional regulator with XRE-family HTH domain